MPNFEEQAFSNYQEVTSITRCRHFDDAVKVIQHETFFPQEVFNWPGYSASPEVMWFSPSIPPEKHNIFGNVSFILAMKEFVKTYGKYDINVYYIDTLDHVEESRKLKSRILITPKSYPHLQRLNKGSYREGSPLSFSFERETFFAAQSVRWNGMNLRHSVLLAVENHGDMNRRMFRLAKIEANDHSRANTYIQRKMETKYCFKYNNLYNKCPYKLSRQETSAKLKPYLEEYESGRGLEQMSELSTGAQLVAIGAGIAIGGVLIGLFGSDKRKN